MIAQALPFVHPAIAGAALAAGAIPVVIHLLNRRRYRVVPWAAMTFILAASRRSAKRLQVEQFLLMAARIALIVLFGMAVARPYVPAAGWLPWQAASVHRVILLDDSLSMSAKRADNRTRFQAAREAAMELLNSFPPGDPVSLITLASPAEKRIGVPSLDRRLIRDQLLSLGPTQRATDPAGAVAAAIEILKGSPAAPGNRSAYLISDFSAALWLGEPGTAGQAPPTDAVRSLRQLAASLADATSDLHLIRADDRAGANVAVTELAIDSRLIARDVPLRLRATVTNFSQSPSRAGTIQFRQDGRIIRREPIPEVPPGESASVSSSLLFAESGTHAIEARIVVNGGDDLSVDDVRFLSVEVPESTNVLLVDGRPGVSRLDGQAGFLATALSPEAAASSRYAGGPTRNLVWTKTIAPAELAAEPFASYDVVALCNIARLTPEKWSELRSYVESGGGLLVFGGDALNRENYNRFGYADGAGVIPVELENVAEVAGAGPAGDRGIALSADDLTHPLLSEFRDQPTSGLFLARVFRYLTVSFDAARAQSALRYSTGDAALVASEFGKGRTVVCTTTANMDWNNLAAKGDYVSLMLSVVSYLSGARHAGRNLQVGQAATEPLSAAESAMPLSGQTAAGATILPELTPLDSGLAARMGPLQETGIVTLLIGSSTRKFAVNSEPVESDLAVASPEALSNRVGFPARWLEVSRLDPAQVGGRHSTELGSFALYAATVLLLGELWLAMWFSSPRGGAA